MTPKLILLQNSTDADAPPTAVSEHRFEGNLISVGSDATSTIVLPNTLLEQAVFIREGEQITLINAGEGTILNNRALRREAMEPLTVGDQIKIGKFIIFVADGAANGDKPPVIFNEKTTAIFASDNEAVQTSENGRETNLFDKPARDFESETESKKPTRNFSDVLNALRTEEDSFYFILENGTSGENTRVPIEQSEMPIGLNASGQITCVVNQINALCAVVRKDWSGIVVETQRGGAVTVNDESIKTTARLRNGDRLTLTGARKNKRQTPYLELHEPSSLVALESILETRARNGNLYANPGADSAPTAAQIAAAPVSIFERNFFGYFSFFEVVTMVIGTLIGAVLIFLLLEFSI